MLKEIKYSSWFQKSLRIFKSFIKAFSKLIGISKNKSFDSRISNENGIGQIQNSVQILTTLHCIYIAQLIKQQLAVFNIKSDIIFKEPQTSFSNDLHFVICPQMYKKLPTNYVAFQMEQSVSSRWFTDEYFNKLNKSKAILDYSLTNIQYLLKNNISFNNTYYVPIDILKQDKFNSSVEKYDVVFYGDANNERRQKYLKKLSENFNVKVISNCFGEDLYQELIKAKIIVNIHYYEGALLETTRLFECLSLNKFIISETSVDIDEYPEISKMIEFVEIDDIEKMVSNIKYWLNNDNKRIEKLEKNSTITQTATNNFEYYFNRFLLAENVINFDQFINYTNHQTLNSNQYCLSLPECHDRRLSFLSEHKTQFVFFNGLRNKIGWIGCAYSYKYILYLAKLNKLKYIGICEDDTLFPVEFDNILSNILTYLENNHTKWDIFSGFIADVHREMEVTNIEKFNDTEIIYIDKLMSMVYNIYNESIYNILDNWTSLNLDKDTNTIDKYLESKSKLRITTTQPFLVGHKDDLNSSIWENINNSFYNKQINKSAKLLEYKIGYYKKFKSLFNQ